MGPHSTTGHKQPLCPVLESSEALEGGRPLQKDKEGVGHTTGQDLCYLRPLISTGGSQAFSRILSMAGGRSALHMACACVCTCVQTRVYRYLITSPNHAT